MGETTDQVKALDNPTKADEASDNDASHIRSNIEQTRAELSDTISALQHKLDPAHIAEQVKEQIRDKASEAFETAKQTVKEATIGKAEKIVASVSETVSQVTGRAGEAVMDTSSSLVQYVRDNPIPFALLGVGLGMLALNKRKSQQPSYHQAPMPPVYHSYATNGGDEGQVSFAEHARDVVGSVAQSAKGAATSVADTARVAADRATTAVSSAASTVRDVAGSAAGSARQKLHDVRDQAVQGAHTATGFFQTTLEENPMVLGVAALAAGALVGLTLPTTRLEGEYMGEARDRLVDQAKSVAQEAAGKVQRVTQEAGRTLKETAQKEGLMPEEVPPAS